MIVREPEPEKKVVEDYDFVFSSGQTMPVTIDRSAGDTVSFESAPVAVQIMLSAKPSLTSPDIILPAEEITIFQHHLIAIQKRLRIVTGLTVEQQEQWKKALAEFKAQPKTVQ